MKPSFKTTTLIATIGMSIAVGFSLIVQFINSFTGIDLYVHPIRMQALWRIQDAVWWSSVLLFFLGMFRHPNQLPELSKWSKRIAIAVIGIVVFLYVDRLFYSSYSDPLWLKISRYSLRFVTHGGYLAAMWCYFNSANRQTPTAIRYVSLAAVMACCMGLFYIVTSTIAWWFSLSHLRYYWYDVMSVFHCIIYVATIACALVGIYTPKTSPIEGDKKQKQIKRMTIVGWILLAAFTLNATLIGFAIARPSMPEWLELCIFLFFVATPVIAGIYLFVACRALQKAYDIIDEQQKQLKL